MILSINPENPQTRLIRQATSILQNGGILVYPTDSVYGLAAGLTQRSAVEKICRIRQLDPRKANLTLICQDISQVSRYARQLDNQLFRIMKANLPGPFTFILNAGKQIPNNLLNKRKTIGIRIPDHPIPQALLAELDEPFWSLSLRSDDEVLEYWADPHDIDDELGKRVDMIIDGGVSGLIASTVVDCTSGELKMVREGARDLVL